MVDVTKMYLRIKDDSKWFNTMSINLELKRTNYNSEFKYYEGKLFFHDDKSSTDFDGARFLKIQLTKHHDSCRINILYSIQDWYLGDSATEGFSKSSYNDCINLLSKKLSIASFTSHATISELTWKAKIAFRKEHANFMSCIFDHKTLKNKSITGRTKIKFWGKDKNCLIIKKRNLPEIANDTKINFHIHFQIESKNVPNDKFLKNNAHCLKAILENWNQMVDEWENQLNNLVIVNSFSPDISDYLNDSNMTKMSGYLVYVGIKHYGLENFRQLMTDKMVSKKLYEYRNNYMKIYEKFENLDTLNYRSYFKTNVELIAEKLKK
jgi:hypothetical protein